MEYYTYAYLREDKTPYYIGKGKGNRAYKRGRWGIKPPKDKSRILILKNNLTEEESFKHEVYMIAVFGRKDLGTGILHNKTNGGEGSSGAVRSDEWKRKQSEAKKNMSDETRKKMSEAKKGRIVSKETKRKLSKAGKGKTHSDETKRKMSEANKGKTHSEESRRKMSEANKGKTHSEEHKKKLSVSLKGENNPMFGKTHNEETKKKLSELKIGKKCWNDGAVNKFSIDCPGDGWVLGRK